jgi:tetraacyldisaccharide 4'-kinase
VRIGTPLLWPLSLPYAAAARLRAAGYRAGVLAQQRLDARVISVGNLTVGGTGKTPMVLWIAKHLLAEGRRTGILTRGYRGQPTNARGASGKGGGPSGYSTSDELQLLNARLDAQVVFGVGADRFANGQRLVREGVNWLILDDGFQHLQLARDVDVLLIDATDPFGGGRVVPAGRLREPRSSLKRADLIVITRSDHAPTVEAVIRRYSQAPIFYALTVLLPPRFAREEYPGEQDLSARAKRLFAFCGIGNPGAFTSDLRNWGFQVVGRRFFRDHHRYTREDLQAVEREALAARAEGLICTEKDLFNLGNNRPESLDIRYCPISLEVPDSERLWRAIEDKAHAALPGQN